MTALVVVEAHVMKRLVGDLNAAVPNAVEAATIASAAN